MTTIRTATGRWALVGIIVLAAAVAAQAQEPIDHSGADKAARPAVPAEAAEPAPAEQAAPEAAPEAAAPAAPAGRVALGFGTGIDRTTRELVGEGAAFAGGDTVWCRTVLENLSWPTTVTHAWYHGGLTMARVELNVGSAHWRTWSSKIILPEQTGRWEVKVLDADGSVLGAGAFEIR